MNLCMIAAMTSSVNFMNKELEKNKQREKCLRCAELSGCYKGQNGGHPNCKNFSPKDLK